MTTKTRPTFTIVVETADWRIERNRDTRDFDCFVSGAGYIGSEPTQQAAQALINDYRYQTMTRAPEPATVIDECTINCPGCAYCTVEQAAA
jgi:hypothetical protein